MRIISECLFRCIFVFDGAMLPDYDTGVARGTGDAHTGEDMNPIPDSTQRSLSIEHKIDQWEWQDYAVFSWTVEKILSELVWYIQTETSPRHKARAQAMYDAIWERFAHARSQNDWQDSHSL